MNSKKNNMLIVGTTSAPNASTYAGNPGRKERP